MLAARSGQLLVPAALATALSLSHTTIKHYLGLLEEVFLIRRVPAWSRNLSTRAVGTMKVAMVDSGIAADLLDLDARRLGQLAAEPGGPLGMLLEGFVAVEVARQLSWSRQRAELYHYRTKDKVEVDLLLEDRRGRVVAIEVKAASTVRGDDFRGSAISLTGSAKISSSALFYTRASRLCRSARGSARCRSVRVGSSLPSASC